LVEFKQKDLTTFYCEHLTANGFKRKSFIGNSKSVDFQPVVEITPFENDSDCLRVEYIPQGTVKPVDLTDKAQLIFEDDLGEFAFSPLMTALHEEFDKDLARRNNGAGVSGIKATLLLNAKPKIDFDGFARFSFQVYRYENMRFSYQPHDASGENQDTGAPWKIINNRPDCAKGSYAVYHKSKANNRFTTGKVCHIYRPWCQDSLGNFTWGEWEWDETHGILTKCIPEKAFDSGKWWMVDFTFGDTDSGASGTQNVEDHKLVYNNVTPSDGNGNGDTLHADINVTTEAKLSIMGLYTNADTTIVANGCTGAELVAIDWDAYKTYTFGTQPAIVGTTSYDIMLHTDNGDGNFEVYYDSDVGNGTVGTWNAYDGTCDSPHGVSSGNSKFSLYCTYSAASACDTLVHSAGTASDSSYTCCKTAATTYYATKFTAPKDATICRIDVFLDKVASPTMNVAAGIWGHDAGNDEPENGDIKDNSDTIVASTFPANGSPDWVEFSTNLSAAITNGDTFWVVVFGDATDATNHFQWHNDDAAVELVKKDADGAAWAQQTAFKSMMFRLYEESAGNVEVSCNTDALSLTEYSTTVKADMSISAGIDNLALSTLAASIKADMSITAGVDALTLSELQASIKADMSIVAGVDALALTEIAAAVKVDRNVLASIDALILTEYGANITDGLAAAAVLRRLLLLGVGN